MKKLLILLVLGLTACKLGDLLFYPTLPPSSVHFTPPAIYQEWYLQVKSCMDSIGAIKDDIGSVYNANWYAIYDSVFQAEIAGEYDRFHTTFWISRPYIGNRLTISHELIHSFGYRNSAHGTQVFDCELPYVNGVIDHEPVHIPELDSVWR